MTVNKDQHITVDGTVGDVHVATGGTLLGVGKVKNLIVDTGGIVAPGHSPGCLTADNLSLSGTYQAQLEGTEPCHSYDQITVTGAIILKGKLEVSLGKGFKPMAGQRYTLINNTGTQSIKGTFTGLAEGATIKADGYTFQITYKGGTGNDAVLTARLAADTASVSSLQKSDNPLSYIALAILLLAAAAAGVVVVRKRRSGPRRKA